MATQSKAAAAVAATFVLSLSILVWLQTVEVAKANPMYNVKPAYESFIIRSPENGSANEGSILVKFTVKTNAPSDMHNNYCFKIDDAKPVLVANISVVEGTLVSNDVNPNSISDEGIYNPNPPYYIPYVDYVLEGNSSLPSLSEGWHNVTVNRGTAISDPKIQSTTVRFFAKAIQTPSPSRTPSTTPMPSLTESASPLPSSTQRSTMEPSLTANPTGPMHNSKLLPYSLIIAFAVAAVAAVFAAGFLICFTKRKGMKS